MFKKGLLADCYTRDPSQTELILLQSGSAEEQAKRLRDRETQAILPITPAIVDARLTSIDEVLDSYDCISVIAALGVGIYIPGEPPVEFDMSFLRYSHLYVVSDETEAATHVPEALLAFFRMYNSPLLKAGKISLVTVPRLEGMTDEEFRGSVLSRETRRAVVVSL